MAELMIGLISGIVSGTGMGGGTVLILCLSFMLGVEQHIAQATNLIFFIPTALMAIWVNYRQKCIDFKVGIPIAIAGVMGAVVGAILAGQTEVQRLKKYFGFFLAIIAIWEIYSFTKKYIFKKKSHNKDRKNN